MRRPVSLKDLLGAGLDPLARPSLAEEAAEKLRELILLEKLPPGLPVNERDLSDALGISRTPVREAIRLLEIEGLIDYTETRRPRIADPTMECLKHWLDVQGALEGLAGELACTEASDAELAEIDRLHRKMIDLAENEDALERFTLDMAFHTAIVAAAHNPPLAETHSMFNARLWRARFVSSQFPGNRETQMHKHQEIVDALLARNTEASAKALRHHLGNAIHNIAKSRGCILA